MPSILLHLVPASMYAALGVHFWRSRWQAAGEVPRRGLSAWERAALLMALLAHGAVLHRELFPGSGMHFGFGTALSLMVWLAVVFYWIENFFSRLDGLQTFVMPAAAVCAFLPGLFPPPHLLAQAGSPAFRAHFIVAMLAYSLFTLATLHAILMSIAEKRLHHARLSAVFASLPPLLTMERLLFRLIRIAFVLLTLTLISGVMFSEALFGKAFQVDHKTVFAFISWLLFGALLMGRRLWGWRGKMAQRWTMAGFVALMLAYVGSRFVLEVLLHRPV
ncbi:cytochrome c biogenesis protein CcsA [Nitrogeniibacter mangrovi]|uniref:Cytochrome c biogenesis protein CcsA n=1 Tax=Nitrogeniibacter mangrovi TaxID=2016596 RepID=A0A6C1B4V2_9RHOO|nr:cytochrome c biogenesis protein CcsA [Nitrogeniibacter mangrovi]QID18507.1 cytochrome c biogenesis protein CcsA [Nitrogeniibacter mangrovi]